MKPDTASVDKFLEEIRKPANQPAFIHCAGGNRAAAIWMIKRRARRSVGHPARAAEEADSLGLTSSPMKQFAVDYIQAHKHVVCRRSRWIRQRFADTATSSSTGSPITSTHPERYPVLVAREARRDHRRAADRARRRSGEPFDAIMADFERVLVPGLTHWNHPGFFAYFAITGSAPGVLAEFLSAALNQQAMLWRTSPAATELEAVTLGWLRS